MYFSPYYYLSLDICLLILQTLSLTGNGLIICFFYGNGRLRSQRQLRLILTLAIADFLFAASTMPYIVFFMVGWNTTELMYNGFAAVALAQPLVIHFKINLSIATGIAIDRLQAMRWPMYYRKKNVQHFNYIILAIGIVLAIIDVVIEYSLSIKGSVPGCNTIGCFVSHQFRLYWGVSNMIFNFLMLILALIVIYDFNQLRKRSKNVIKVAATGTAGKKAAATEEWKERQNFNQANRLSVSILAISIVFLLIPSIFVGAVDYFGMETFEHLGPFYLLGLLLAGVSNSFTYITFHAELRAAAYNFFCGRRARRKEQQKTCSNNAAAAVVVTGGP